MTMTEETYHAEVAKTIMSQMKALDISAVFAWGSRNWVAVPAGEHKQATVEAGVHKPFVGGLHFRVSGLSFKGHIVITLNGSDLYDIVAISNYEMSARGNGKPKFAISDVYAEDLVYMLDGFIEKNVTPQDYEMLDTQRRSA
jgi:hypothetical protein